MAPVLRRLPLERAILIAVPVAVLGVALSSSWSTSLQDIGRPVRAAGLLALAALSLAYAWTRGGRLDRRAVIVGAGFFALALVSAAWSGDPRETLAKAAAFGLVLLIAGAVATAVDARKMLWSVLAGAVVVALAGLLVAVVSPNDAVQAATRSVGRRYRGIGVNPNTAAMLCAVGVPLAAALWLEARGRARMLAAGAFLLLAGSIVAAGSRGAAAAAVAGLLVLAVFRRRQAVPRAVAAGAAVALAVTAILITAVSAPLSEAEAARARTFPVGSTEKYTPNDAQYIVRLEDELGSGSSGTSRRIFDTSGRLQAWRGALRQGDDRPLLGYGFGTEESVFVDRYRHFEGGVPENSFLGLFLQLGVVGLALFGALVAALAATALRATRTGGIALAVLATGIVLAVVQSYIFAVGNVATLSVWICAFLPAGRE